jgi:EmrB/QacA subfamily drug resistance transporter
MVGLFLAGLDGNIVATAMPTIAGKLGGFTKLAWVSTSYVVSSTIATPVMGKLSDLYGRRRVYLIAISAFLGGSVLCGLSQTINQLIAARAVQGIGGGGIMSLSFAIVGQLVTPRERGKYMGYFTSMFALSSVAGPLIGGWMIDHVDWRWIFLVNLPVGLAALFITSSALKIPFERLDAKVDFAGAALLTVSVGSLLFGLQFGPQKGWGSPLVLGLFLVSVVGLLLLIKAEGRASEPMIPGRLLRDRVVAISCAMGFFAGMTMYAASVYFAIYFQDVVFKSPTSSGLRTVPIMFGALCGSMTIGRRITATGRYKIYPLFGLCFMATGSALAAFGLGPSTPYLRLAIAMGLIGLGMGCSMPSVTVASQNAVPAGDLGIATATTTFFRTLGGSIALAAFSTLFNASVKAKVHAGFARAGLGQPENLSKIIREPKQIKALAPATRSIVQDALSTGASRVFLGCVVASLLCLALATILPERPLRTSHEAAPAFE